MRSIIIENKKVFTEKLFIGNDFDNFLVSDVEICMGNSFNISGKINKSFYSDEEFEALTEKDYVNWAHIKPICFDIIKGKKTPTKFKMVFLLSKENLAKTLESSGLSYTTEDVNALFINVRYEGDVLVCTTGLSMKTFTLDKSLEEYWDNTVQKFVDMKF